MNDIKKILESIVQERRNYTKNSREIYDITSAILSGVQELITDESKRKTELRIERSEDNSNEYIVYMLVDGSPNKILIAKYILNASCAYPVIIKFNQAVEFARSDEDLKAVLFDMIREKINSMIDIASGTF